eukprot:scaffold9159_cov67-Skeletonema_marinoi.AAC.4
MRRVQRFQRRFDVDVFAWKDLFNERHNIFFSSSLQLWALLAVWREDLFMHQCIDGNQFHCAANIDGRVESTKTQKWCDFCKTFRLY